MTHRPASPAPRPPAAAPLRTWCEAQGVSPRRLSLDLGCNQHLVGRILAGERRPSEATIQALAHHTGLDAETLRGGPAPSHGPLADRLRAWCAATGTSGAELARRVGRSGRFKEVLEGKVAFVGHDLLERLAQATGLQLMDLAVPAGHVRSLADAIAAVERAAGSPGARKAEIRRDLERLARGLMRDPAAVPATREEVLAPLQAEGAHRQFQIAMPFRKGKPNRKRWRNFLANVAKALELLGPARPGRPSRHLGPAWRRLHELARPLGKPAWAGVARLARVADAHGIAPEALDDGVLALLRADLAADPRHADRGAARIRALTRDAIRKWNDLADRLAGQGWPEVRLTPPEPAGWRFRLRRGELTPALQAELEAYRSWATATVSTPAARPSRYTRPAPTGAREEPLDGSTAEGHVKALVLVAQTLVEQGQDPASLISIRQLVAPAAVRATLEAIDARHDLPGGRCQVPLAESGYAQTIAQRLARVARHHARLPNAELAELDDYAIKARPTERGHGVSPRNMSRLRQFGERRIREYLRLPSEIVDGYVKARRAAGGVVGREMAGMLMRGVALMLLRICPMRRKNLGTLRWGTHFIPPGARGETGWLVIPAHETKHRRVIERRILPHRWQVLAMYMAEAQPLLRAEGDLANDHLFPSPVRRGTHIGLDHLSQVVADVVRERLDVQLHLHLIRHLTGWIILRREPQALAVVSRILDHASVAVTQRFYAELDTDLAAGLVDAMLDNATEPQGGDKGKPKRGARR
jgi:transcriptional regulator with XRE-family HTH domain/integrase